MPRTRTFDPDAVVDGAVELFRRHGFAALGVEELTSQLGVSRSSLYGTWGSKQGLWLAALERYRAEQLALLDAAMAAEDPLDGLVGALDVVLDGLAAAPDDGCMVVNAACERGGLDEQTSDLLAPHLAELRERVDERLRTADAQGLVREGVDLDGVASLVTVVLEGVGVLRRVEGGARIAADGLREAQRVVSDLRVGEAATTRSVE